MLNTCMFPEQKTTVLLETMAGKGTEVGRTFEELAAIIDKAVMNDKIGVCLDTCHVFDGGYDIVHELDDVLLTFDKVIGLDRLNVTNLEVGGGVIDLNFQRLDGRVVVMSSEKNGVVNLRVAG